MEASHEKMGNPNVCASRVDGSKEEEASLDETVNVSSHSEDSNEPTIQATEDPYRE
jgi:hypothetical protein